MAGLTSRPLGRFAYGLLFAITLIIVPCVFKAALAADTAAVPPLIDPDLLKVQYPDLTVASGVGSSSSMAMMRDLTFIYRTAKPGVFINHVTDRQLRSPSTRSEYLNGNVDYLLSITLLSSSDMAKVSDTQNYPLVVSGLVPMVNLPELDDNEDIWLDRKNMLEIFNGTLSKWNDPSILQTNLKNPAYAKIAALNKKIEVIVRADSSSTTNVFIRTLISFSNNTLSFADSVSLSKFPMPDSNYIDPDTGKTRIRRYIETEACLAALQTTPYGISYMLWTTATASTSKDTSRRYRVKVVPLINKFGNLVRPTVETIQSAMVEKSQALLSPITKDVTLFDGASPESWPIAYINYLLIRKDFVRPKTNCDTRAATAEFFHWFYTSSSGTPIAERYNYLMLPESVRLKLGGYVQQNTLCSGGKPAFFFGINGKGPEEVNAVLPVYTAMYSIKDPAAAIGLVAGWDGESVDALSQVANGLIPFAVLPSSEVTRASESLPENERELLTSGPIFLASLGVFYNHPDFDGTNETSLLTLSMDTLAGILSGSITKWNDISLRRLNSNEAGDKLSKAETIKIILYDSPVRWEYTALYHALARFPSVQAKIFQQSTLPGGAPSLHLPSEVEAYTAASDSNTLESLILQNPYSIGLKFRVAKRDPFVPIARMISSSSSVISSASSLKALVGSPSQLMACGHDIRMPVEKPASLLHDVNLSRIVSPFSASNETDCWPLTDSLSVVLRRQYAAATCRSVAHPLLGFWGWYTDPSTSGEVFERYGLSSLSEDVKAYTREIILRSITCANSPNVILNTGTCIPAHIKASVAPQCVQDGPVTVPVHFEWIEPKTCDGGQTLLPDHSIWCDYLPGGSDWGLAMKAHLGISLSFGVALATSVIFLRHHPAILLANYTLMLTILTFGTLRMLASIGVLLRPTNLSCGFSSWLDDLFLNGLLDLLIVPTMLQWIGFRSGRSVPRGQAIVLAALIPLGLFLIITTALVATRSPRIRSDRAVTVMRDWTAMVPYCEPTTGYGLYVSTWTILTATVGIVGSFYSWRDQKHIPNGRISIVALLILFSFEIAKRAVQNSVGKLGDAAVVPEAVGAHLLLLGTSLCLFTLVAPKLYTALTVSKSERRFQALDTSSLTKINSTEALLNALHGNSMVRSKFRDYLQAEHAEENLMFLEMADRLEETSDPRRRLTLFQDILDEYIRLGSPYEVNVSDALRKELMMFEEATSVDSKVLSATKQQVLRLLLDSFMRFSRAEALASMSARRKTLSSSQVAALMQEIGGDKKKP